MMLKNNMGSVLAENAVNAAVFIKDSPYCNTLHIALYGELPIWGRHGDPLPKSFVSFRQACITDIFFQEILEIMIKIGPLNRLADYSSKAFSIFV